MDFFTLPRAGCVQPNVTYFTTMVVLCSALAGFFLLIAAFYVVGRTYYRSSRHNVGSSKLHDEARRAGRATRRCRAPRAA